MEKSFIRDFREVVRIFEREIFYQNNASCCGGISLAQCHTLLEIQKKEKISVSELAGRLSLDKSTISRTVDGLVNAALVNRIIPKENRRKAVLSLTENGKQVCSSIHYSNDSYLENVLQDFTESERKDFLRLFRNLTSNMVTARETLTYD